jgi:hypothetical protein
MMKSLLIAVVLLGSSLALAQSPQKVKEFKEDEWGDTYVDGKLDGPDLPMVTVVRPGKHDSLLKVRENFRAEVLSSVSSLP